VTRKPTEEFEGCLQATAGKYDQIKLEGAIGGALTDQLMAWVSFATHDNDGYAENRFLDKKLNNANDEAYRAQILWTPTDSMEILLSARSGDQSIDTGFFEHVTSNITGQLTLNEVNVVTGYIDTDGDVFKSDYDRDGHNDLETRGYTGTVKWDLENFTLASITDISTVKRDYIEDSDASPVPLFNFFLTSDAKQFSQEIRLNGGNEQMNWVAGAYFLDLNIEDSNGAKSEPFIDPVSDTPDVSGLDNPYETNTESISVFGQVGLAFADTLTGIAGLRWIQDKRTIPTQPMRSTSFRARVFATAIPASLPT